MKKSDYYIYAYAPTTNKKSNLKARLGVRQFADVDKLATVTNIMQII